MSFLSNYSDWTNVDNGFIEYLNYSQSNPGGHLASCVSGTCVEPTMIRVIFSAGGTLCNSNYTNSNCLSENLAPSTTVSEGIGYGLLLSYANDDEATFKGILQYWYYLAQTYGCAMYDATTTFTCLTVEPYQMPWIVDKTGQPFAFSSASTASAIINSNTFFSSGSATDADIQIAWAVYLAIEKFGDNTITDINGNIINYSSLASAMTKAIRKNDVDSITQAPTPPGASTITFINKTQDILQIDYPQAQVDFSAISGNITWNGTTYKIAPGTSTATIGSLPNINTPNYGPSIQISDWSSGSPAFSYNIYLGTSPSIKSNPTYPTQTKYQATSSLSGNNTTITFDLSSSKLKGSKSQDSASTYMYNPGNQWSTAGEAVLYPGYMTPQAYDIFDANASTNQWPLVTTCSAAPSFGQMQIINTTETVINIDAPTANTIFATPWPTGLTYANGAFKIAPLSNVTVTMNNLFNPLSDTLKLSSYNAAGSAIFTYTLKVDGTFGPTITNPNFSGCSSSSSNSYQIVISDINITKELNFKFQDVVTDSLSIITNFQKQFNTGLMPNVVQLNGIYTPTTAWSNAFAYDAIRFPLWVSAYIAANPTSPLTPILKPVLASLLNTINTNASSWIQKGTFANAGIDGTQSPPAIVGGVSAPFSSPAIALNACLYAACKQLDSATYSNIISAIQESVINYDITNSANQPSPSDAIGDSGPYFNAALLLLAEVIISNKLK